MTYEPPYTLNTSIFSLLEQVNQEIGMLKGLKVEFSTPKRFCRVYYKSFNFICKNGVFL